MHGAETAIPGTSVFTGERSQQGYRLNRFAMSLTDPANRARFLADEATYMRAMELDEQEADMVRRRDWPAMIDHGGSIYLILKIAGTIGQTLLQMGAQMRGETLEQFMATRPGTKGH
jgi:protocatechuate 4,5-dioxygenase alpha subunit